MEREILKYEKGFRDYGDRKAMNAATISREQQLTLEAKVKDQERDVKEANRKCAAVCMWTDHTASHHLTQHQSSMHPHQPPRSPPDTQIARQREPVQVRGVLRVVPAPVPVPVPSTSSACDGACDRTLRTCHLALDDSLLYRAHPRQVGGGSIKSVWGVYQSLS